MARKNVVVCTIYGKVTCNGPVYVLDKNKEMCCEETQNRILFWVKCSVQY